MHHYVEVDQSIKVEQTHQHTVLAFSDGIQQVILIPAEVKRACQRELRSKGVKPGMIALRMFSAGILLLLEGQMDSIAGLTIDMEYKGKEGEIKRLLLRFILGWVPGFPKEAIAFQQIGKKSGAHRLAWETHRGERKPNRVVTLKELLQYR